MKIDLKNNIILVTGAAGAIGASIVRAMAEYGATVAIHYNKKAAGAKEVAVNVGNRSQPFQADLSKPENCVKLFQDVLSAYGRLDTLVNNAGVYLRSPNEESFDGWLLNWERTMAINLTAAGVLCREAVNCFKNQGGGRIVNVASRAAFRGDYEDYFAYAASKGGMVALSRTIARTYGKYNIKSFVVAPGFVRTPVVDEYIKKHGSDSVMKDLALAELTTPEDVAPTVVFLASGLMDHATGCTVDINAGSYVR